MEKSRANSSSPLATIEEIQRRLTRPPSLRSQSTISYATAREGSLECDSPQFDATSTLFETKLAAKGRDATNKRLETQSVISSATARENIIRCDSPQFEENWTRSQRKSAAKERDATNKRLEDYLDPVLLSAIRAKIGGKRNREGAIYKPKELEIAFEWPVDELKALGEGSMSERGAKWRGYEAVDLGDDVGAVRVGGGGEDEAFELFEREARKRFRR